MPVDIKAVLNSSVFPQAVDVAVVGAGIIGACTAYELARKGASVALFDKGVVGGEQSGRNWGYVRQQNRDLLELELAMFSLRRWEELGPEIGEDLGFRRTGILYCTTKQDDLARWADWGKAARAQGFRSEILSAADTQNRTRRNVSRWTGGVWSPTDGRAEPGLAAPGIVEGAKRLGVIVHQGCAVRGLEITDGQVGGVWTERGLVRATAVVCAGGGVELQAAPPAWSRPADRKRRRHCLPHVAST